MKNLKFIFIIALTTSIFAGCGGGKKQPQVAVTQKKTYEFAGNYVTDDYLKKKEGYDWVAILVKQTGDSTYHVSARSRIDIKKPTCTFDANAVVKDTNQLIASLDGKNILFTFKDSLIQIVTEKEEDAGFLNYYCSGGATIAGSYKKIQEPLDTNQIDQRNFTKFLTLQNISFDISTKGEGSIQQLTVQPYGLSVDNQKFVTEIEGSVENAEIEDLNADGFPEVLIYTISAGSGSYGNVIGYSVNKGKSISQIAFPDITDNPKASQGFMGHDQFRIVESSLVQRFQVFNPNDTNNQPTGNIRQIQYKLKEGEACRLFVVDKIVEYPAK